MRKYAISIGKHGATYLFDYSEFVRRGGLTDEWGKHWEIVEAASRRDARVIALRKPNASKPHMFCMYCFADLHDPPCKPEDGQTDMVTYHYKIPVTIEVGRDRISHPDSQVKFRLTDHSGFARSDVRARRLLADALEKVLATEKEEK